MRHFPAQLGRPLDAVGLGAARLVVVGAPVPLLAVGAAVEGREAAGAPRRRLGAADGTLAPQWHQILVHCLLLIVTSSVCTPHLISSEAMGAYFAMSARSGRRGRRAEESLPRLSSAKFCFGAYLPHEVEVLEDSYEDFVG